MHHPFLVGKKVYLRGVEQKDLEGKYFDWLNDSEVTKYLDSGYFPNTLENMQEYVKSAGNNVNNVLLGIIDIETDNHVGNVRLGPIQWIHRNSYIGIILGDRDFWGKGYATETLKLIAEYAFRRLNLHKISAGINASNKASIRAFEKAGFKTEAIRKDEVYADGKYHDGVTMALISEEFQR